MKNIIKKVVGVILILVGLFALVTPLTPGSWLALIGLELLGIRHWAFRTFLTEKQRVAVEKFMEEKLKIKKKPEENNKNNQIPKSK